MRLIFLFTFCLSQITFAAVDIKSGAFTLSRTDQILPSLDLEFPLRRSYNSAVDYDGLFGYGWCSTLESSLTIVGPNEVVIRECGAGTWKLFSIDNQSEDSRIKSIDKLIEVLKKNGKFLTASLKDTLKWNPGYRAELVRRNNLEFPVETGKLVSKAYDSGEQLEVTANSFIQIRKNGIKVHFSRSGIVQKVVSDEGSELIYRYEGKKLKSVQSNRGQKLLIFLNSIGKISEVRSSSGKSTRYEYDGKFLSKVKNGKAVDRYTYSDNRIASSQIDGVTTKVTHSAKLGAVETITSDKCSEKFSYDIDQKSFKFVVDREIDCKGQSKNKVTYSFSYKLQPDGALYQSNMEATDSSGRKTRAEYAAEGKPTSTERNGKTLKYTRDSQMRITAVESGLNKVQYSYNSSGQLTEAKQQRLEKQSWINDLVSKFAYDSNGNLTKVSRSDGETVSYSYGVNRNLARAKGSSGTQVDFEHDLTNGRIGAVTIKSLGQFKLNYDREGQITHQTWTGAIERAPAAIEIYSGIMSPLQAVNDVRSL